MGTATITGLQQIILNDPYNPKGLSDYISASVQASQERSALKFLSGLQLKHPSNHLIRKNIIGLHLHLNHQTLAMEETEKLVAFSGHDDALLDAALAIRKKLGPRQIVGLSSAHKTISVCMIVKNEQRLLAPCLNAIKGLADELIVVDTGSTDRSIDIARIYGASVYSFQWNDDFSAARNLSLDKANGHWILILDADELIAPQDFVRIHESLSTNQALTFTTRNYTNQTNAVDWQANDRTYPTQETGLGWFPSRKIRMFPRCENIRFTYPVHELVEPSIRAAGLETGECPVPIHHYGQLNEAKNTEKAKKYFSLGYAKLEQLGDNGVALRELAIQAGQLEKWGVSIELWQRYLDIFPNDGEAHANMGGAYWQLEDYDQGEAFSRKAITLVPDLKEGYYNLAVNLMMKNQAKAAVAALEYLLQKSSDYLAAKFMLGVAYAINGDQQQSLNTFEEVGNAASRPVLNMAFEEVQQKVHQSNLPASIKSSLKSIERHMCSNQNLHSLTGIG
jgi:glycosyltransferase involved in cell wall biosynthesis